jgi:hypothetical protein
MAVLLLKVNSVSKVSRLLKILLFIFIISFLIAILLFSLFYFFSDYNSLKNWYFSLNSCFYKSKTWPDNFFTPAVKSIGNYFAIAGVILPIAFFTSFLLIGGKRNVIHHTKKPAFLNTTNLIWYAIIIVLAIIVNTWGSGITSPSYDEIFSAVNCAELPSFQIISYYMLPNNHMYFNLLNHLIFGSHIDLIRSGRLISLVAYTLVLISIFRFFYKSINDRLLSFIALLPVALQFTIWGFGFQARGYECQLLVGWISVIAIFNYLTNNTERRIFLSVNTVANIGGFILIPSYLYWYLAQVFFVLILTGRQKSGWFKFLLHQAICIVFVFLFYLPALCFSGLHALAENKYVKADYENLATFFPDFISYFKYYLGICFSNGNIFTNLLLLCLPLVLFFSKSLVNRRLALFYLIQWVVFVVLTLILRHAPFDRNLIIHFSFTMAMVVYTVYVLINAIFTRLNKIRQARYAVFLLPILFCGFYLAQYDKAHITDIYNNSVNATFAEHEKEVSQLPGDATIAFSDESFYFYYLCRESHLRTVRCASGMEDYYIKRTDELLPDYIKINYSLFKTNSEDYQVFKRKH